MHTASIKCGGLNNVLHLTKGPSCPTMAIEEANAWKGAFSQVSIVEDEQGRGCKARSCETQGWFTVSFPSVNMVQR